MLGALRTLWAARPSVATAAALREFLSRQAAYAAQSSVMGYCEVKAGPDKDTLFREAEFRAALDACRWEGFAAVLADLSVLAWTRLAPHAPGREAALAEALVSVFRAVLEEAPRPAHRPGGWDDCVAVFAARMAEARLRPQHPPAEVARVAAKRIMDTLPIHENHRRTDREAIVGAVQFRIVAAWDAMLREMDAAAVAADLTGGAG